MRTFFLLLLFAMPPLVACSAAYAKSTVEIGKPVCTHYDDATKPEQRATSTDVASASSPGTGSPAIAATGPIAAGAGNVASQPKGGGTSGMMHPRTAPRWQTFLPGMFK